METNSEQIHIVATPRIKRVLQAIAHRRGQSMSAAARGMILKEARACNIALTPSVYFGAQQEKGHDNSQ
jgi:hypothetical protein